MGSSLLFIATDFPLVLIPSEYASSEIVVVWATVASLSIIVTVTACVLLGIVLNYKRWLKVYVVMYLLLFKYGIEGASCVLVYQEYGSKTLEVAEYPQNSVFPAALTVDPNKLYTFALFGKNGSDIVQLYITAQLQLYTSMAHTAHTITICYRFVMLVARVYNVCLL